MLYELENIAILNVKGVLRNMTKNDAIKVLNNSLLDNKCVLYWILVQL